MRLSSDSGTGSPAVDGRVGIRWHDKHSWRWKGTFSVTGAAVHWFGQFLGAEEPAKRVAMPFRTADVTLVGGIRGC
jgi:hypothetical protein